MRFSLTLFLVVFHLLSPAQNKVFEQPIGWGGSYLSLQTITNKQQACIFVLGSDSVKAFLTNDHKQYAAIFTVPRILDERYLGGFIKNGSVYLFMDNGNNKGIRCWKYNMAAASVSENQIPFEIKNSRIINRLSSDNYFFYFTYNKKTADFIVYKFADEKKCDTIRYHDASGLWETVTISGFFTRDINVERADMEGECNIDIAEIRNKIYVRNDTLLLIVNSTARYTNIYSFDLTNGSTTERAVKHVWSHGYGIPEVFNSFLMNDRLYFFSAGKQALNLQVLDFYSGKLINEFYGERDADIGFINTNLPSGGSKLTNKVKDAAGRTNKFLRQLTKGNAVIIAQPLQQEGKVVLTLASFRELYQPGSYTMMGPNGGMGVYMPGGTWTQTMRCKTMLNDKTFEHIPGIIPQLINERIDEYIKDKKVGDKGWQLYSSNNQYHYVYYDKKSRSLNVATFGK